MASNINFNVNAFANFSQVQTEIGKLKASISTLQAQPLLGTSGKQTADEIQSIQKRFDQMILSTRAFNMELVKSTDHIDDLGSSLERGKLGLHQYYDLWKNRNAQAKNQLNDLADSQARVAKSFVIPDALKTGYSRVITSINADLKTLGATQDAMNIKTKSLNSVIRGMGTELINLGKNTQWTGRQLTVGLTVPLVAFGAQASKVFQDVDKELTRLAKVYGTGLTITSQQTLDVIRKQTLDLARELATAYGVTAQQTAAAAADLAATGLQGQDLIKSTREVLRLSTLGEIDQQAAIKATIALQQTFKLSTNDTAKAVDFLNAVENQTSTSMGDLVESLPRASNVIKQLGGSYKDLAAMMVALREAGVPAAEGANAIKSAMASLINPSTRATESFSKFGLNLEAITKKNSGNLLLMMKDLQVALDSVDPTDKARLIENIFGKFQFAKITALINNLGTAGSQTNEVFRLSMASSTQLAAIAAKELEKQANSVSGRYNRAIQQFRSELLPLGEQFTKFATKAMNIFSNFLEVINKFGPLKNILVGALGGAAIVGPILMLSGLLINLVGSLIKGANFFRMWKQGFQGIGTEASGLKGAFQGIQNYFEQIDVSSLAASHNVDMLGSNAKNATQAFAILNREIQKLSENLLDIAGHPITPYIPNTKYSSMSKEELTALHIYEADSKQQGGERPHYTSKAEALKQYYANPSATPQLQAVESSYIAKHGPQAGAEKFKQYFEEGQMSQYGMVPQGSAAGLLQRRYGQENVIYGNAGGPSKDEIFARETQRLIDIHDQIIRGKIKDEELAGEELTRILGFTSQKGRQLTDTQIAELQIIIDKVVFEAAQVNKSVVDNLVAQKTLLSGSENAIDELNAQVKRIMTSGDSQSRAGRVSVAWQQFVDTLSANAVKEINNYRVMVTSQISGAATPQAALMAGRNLEAEIALTASRKSKSFSEQLGPGETMGAQRLKSTIVGFSEPTKKLQSGGSAWVPGTGDGDKVPAMLEPGEFVVNKNAAKQYGGVLHDINFNRAPRFQNGGRIPGFMLGGYTDRDGNKLSASDMSSIPTDIAFKMLQQVSPEMMRDVGVKTRNAQKGDTWELKGANGLYIGDTRNASRISINTGLDQNGVSPREFIKSVMSGSRTKNPGEQMALRGTHSDFLDKLLEVGGISKERHRSALRDFDRRYITELLAMESSGTLLTDRNNPLTRIQSDTIASLAIPDAIGAFRQWTEEKIVISAKNRDLADRGRGGPSTSPKGAKLLFGKTALEMSALEGSKKSGTLFAHAINRNFINNILALKTGGNVPGFVSGGPALEEIWGDGQSIHRAPMWQGPRQEEDFGFMTRLPMSRHPFFSTEAEAIDYRREFLSTPRGGQDKIDLKEIFRFINNEDSLKQLAEDWQQGPKKIRNHPEKLQALLSLFSPIKNAMTLRRKTMLGLPGEIPESEQLTLMRALQSGDFESILGKRFNLSGKPSAYTEWGPDWLMSREFHDHPLKMRQSKDRIRGGQSEIERMEKFVADLQNPDKKTAAYARDQLVRNYSMMKSAEDLTPENIERLRQAKQRMLEGEIESQKALSPMGIEPFDVIIQRLFGSGTPMLDVTGANPNAKYRGTKLMEREWLAGPGRPTLDSISQTWIPPSQYTGGAHLYPEWVKSLPYILNMKQRGGVQGLIKGGIKTPFEQIMEKRAMGMGAKGYNLDPNHLTSEDILNSPLYHGDKTGSLPSELGARGAVDSNWFKGDFFTTSNKGIASQYDRAGVKKVSNIPGQQRNLLNILEGGPSIMTQSSSLFKSIYMNFMKGGRKKLNIEDPREVKQLNAYTNLIKKLAWDSPFGEGTVTSERSRYRDIIQNAPDDVVKVGGNKRDLMDAYYRLSSSKQIPLKSKSPVEQIALNMVHAQKAMLQAEKQGRKLEAQYRAKNFEGLTEIQLKQLNDAESKKADHKFYKKYSDAFLYQEGMRGRHGLPVINGRRTGIFEGNDVLRKSLLQNGYTGLVHTGGLATQGDSHNVAAWFDPTGIKTNRLQKGGGIQHLAFGGSALERMAYKPINKLYEIINYLKMRKLLGKGMYHGSYSGIEDISQDGGKLLFDNPGGADVAFGGMQLFTTSNLNEAKSYAVDPYRESDTEESAVYKLINTPLGKYINYPRNLSSQNIGMLKKQNYDLWKMLSQTPQGGDVPDRTAEAFQKLGIKGFFSQRPNITGQTTSEMMNTMWAVLTSPKGSSVSTLPAFPKEESMSQFALLRTLLSQRGGDKEMKEFFESKGNKFQTGGSPWVPGSGDGDRVPAMLEPGEFVVNKKAAKQHGGLLNDLNWNVAPRFATGSGEPGKETLFGSLINKILSPLTTAMQMVAGAERSKAARAQQRESDLTKVTANIVTSANAFKAGVDSIITPIDAMRTQVVRAETGLQNLAVQAIASAGAAKGKLPTLPSLPTKDTSLQAQVRKMSPAEKRRWALGGSNPLEPAGVDGMSRIPAPTPSKMGKLLGKFKGMGGGVGFSPMGMMAAQMAAPIIGGIANKVVGNNEVAKGAIGTATQFGSMGMMFGPQAAIAAAGVGAIYGGITAHMAKTKADAKQAADAISVSTTTSTDALKLFGVRVGDFSNATILASNGLQKPIDKMQKLINSLADSIKSAGDAETQNALKNLKEGNQTEKTTQLKDVFQSTLMSTGSQAKATQAVKAWMKASGMDLAQQGSILSSKEFNPAGKGRTGNEFSSLLKRTDQNKNAGANVLFQASTTTDIKTFNTQLGKAFNSGMLNKINNSGVAFNQFNNQVRATSPSLATLNSHLFKSGAQLSSIAKIDVLAANGFKMTAGQAEYLTKNLKILSAVTNLASAAQSVQIGAQPFIDRMYKKDQNWAKTKQKALKDTTTQINAQVKAQNNFIKSQQNGINAIQKEIDARQKLWDKKQEAIQQQQTLDNLAKEVNEAQSSGDLIGMALAQNAYNKELKNERELKVKQAKDESDQKKIANLQIAIDKASGVIDALNERLNTAQTKFDDTAEKSTNFGETAEKAIKAVRDDVANGKITDEKTLRGALHKAGLTAGEVDKAFENIDKDKNFAKITAHATTINKALAGVKDGFKKQVALALMMGGMDADKAFKQAGIADDAPESIEPKGGATVKTANGEVWTYKDKKTGRFNNPKQNEQVKDEWKGEGWYLRQSGKDPFLSPNKQPEGKFTQGKGTYATGGYISGMGTGTSDSIPAMLSNGEYVVRASAVSRLGRGFLDEINRYATGGPVGNIGGGSVGNRTLNQPNSFSAIKSMVPLFDATWWKKAVVNPAFKIPFNWWNIVVKKSIPTFDKDWWRLNTSQYGIKNSTEIAQKIVPLFNPKWWANVKANPFSITDLIDTSDVVSVSSVLDISGTATEKNLWDLVTTTGHDIWEYLYPTDNKKSIIEFIDTTAKLNLSEILGGTVSAWGYIDQTATGKQTIGSILSTTTKAAPWDYINVVEGVGKQTLGNILSTTTLVTPWTYINLVEGTGKKSIANIFSTTTLAAPWDYINQVDNVGKKSFSTLLLATPLINAWSYIDQTTTGKKSINTILLAASAWDSIDQTDSGKKSFSTILKATPLINAWGYIDQTDSGKKNFSTLLLATPLINAWDYINQVDSVGKKTFATILSATTLATPWTYINQVEGVGKQTIGNILSDTNKPSVWSYLNTSTTFDIGSNLKSTKTMWDLVTTSPKDITEYLVSSTGNKVDFWSWITIVKKKPADMIDASTGLAISTTTTIANDSLTVAWSKSLPVYLQSNDKTPVTVDITKGTSDNYIKVLTQKNIASGWGKATGGYISGPGGPTSDLIPAMLSNGEYVIRASAVSSYGKDMLDSINNRKFATGGLATKYAVGGAVETGNNSSFNDNSVYNINVTANTNANADDIANTVIKTIQRQQSTLTTSRNMGSMR